MWWHGRGGIREALLYPDFLISFSKWNIVTVNISVIERGITLQCPNCGEGMTDDIVHILDSEEESLLWSRCLRACYALCMVVGTLEVWNENLTPVMLVMTNGPLWPPT